MFVFDGGGGVLKQCCDRRLSWLLMPHLPPMLNITTANDMQL